MHDNIEHEVTVTTGIWFPVVDRYNGFEHEVAITNALNESICDVI